jgi:hypothetical protein
MIRLTAVSASKIGPDLIVDDQLDGISTEKLIGSVLDDQIDSISAKIGPDGLFKMNKLMASLVKKLLAVLTVI